MKEVKMERSIEKVVTTSSSFPSSINNDITQSFLLFIFYIQPSPFSSSSSPISEVCDFFCCNIFFPTPLFVLVYLRIYINKMQFRKRAKYCKNVMIALPYFFMWKK